MEHEPTLAPVVEAARARLAVIGDSPTVPWTWMSGGVLKSLGSSLWRAHNWRCPMTDECPKNLRPGNSSWAECRCYNLAMYDATWSRDGRKLVEDDY